MWKGDEWLVSWIDTRFQWHFGVSWRGALGIGVMNQWRVLQGDYVLCVIFRRIAWIRIRRGFWRVWALYRCSDETCAVPAPRHRVQPKRSPTGRCGSGGGAIWPAQRWSGTARLRGTASRQPEGMRLLASGRWPLCSAAPAQVGPQPGTVVVDGWFRAGRPQKEAAPTPSPSEGLAFLGVMGAERCGTGRLGGTREEVASIAVVGCGGWSTWAGEGSLGEACCRGWLGRCAGGRRTPRARGMMSVVVLKKGARTGWAVLW